MERGLEVIAVTDHDSVGGIDEALDAAGNDHRITVIPGVEINTDLATVNFTYWAILLTIKDPELAHALEKIRESRVGTGQKMVDKLQGWACRWNGNGSRTWPGANLSAGRI